MFFTIYKTTNIKNNKFYIGMHKTNNLEDEYLGSGKVLWNSIRYHGKENFRKKILYLLDSEEEMIQKEIELVNEELIKDPLCMNIRLGGKGGWTKEMQSKNGKKGNAKMKILKELDPIWVKNRKQNKSKALKKAYENGRRIPAPPDWTGKTHSKETKEKIGDKNSKNQKGDKNSQYGTIWITDGVIAKKIKKGNPIEEGFRPGRKINS